MSYCSEGKDLWGDRDFPEYLPKSYHNVTKALHEFYKSPRSYPSSEGAPSFTSECDDFRHEGVEDGDNTQQTPKFGSFFESKPEQAYRLQLEKRIASIRDYSKDKWALNMSAAAAQTTSKCKGLL